MLGVLSRQPICPSTILGAVKEGHLVGAAPGQVATRHVARAQGDLAPPSASGHPLCLVVPRARGRNLIHQCRPLLFNEKFTRSLYRK